MTTRANTARTVLSATCAAWLAVIPVSVALAGFWWVRELGGNPAWADAARDLLVLTAGAGIVCLVVVPLYGIPVYLLLRRLHAANLWTVGAAGILPGVLWWFLAAPPERVFAHAALAIGLATSAAFWATARRLERDAGGALWARSRVLRLMVTVMIVSGISVVLLLGTLAFEVPLVGQNERAEVALGYPVPFLHQQIKHQHAAPDAWRLRAPQEYPIRVIWPQLLFNFLVVAALIYAPYWFYRRLKARRR